MEHDLNKPAMQESTVRFAPENSKAPDVPARDWHRERSLRLNKEHLTRQLEITRTTPDLVATTDIDGFLTSLNLAGHRLLGLASDCDITRRRLCEFFTPAYARKLVQTDIPGAITHRVWHSETVLLGAGEEEVPCSQILIAHRDQDFNISFFSLILRDIRPLKQAEKERRQLLEQLHHARKMETIGRLAGGIAHDFNNILTVIVGYAELALDGLENGEPPREELGIILGSAQKASRLSNQLLDFSSKQSITPEILDLNESIEEAHKMLKCLMGEEVEIQCSLEERLFPVRIDHSQIEQVILNLSVNARDAMPSGGLLLFKTRNVSLNRLDASRLGLEKPGDYVKFSICDTGTGMEADVLEHIFEPFYTTKELGKGTGLGLASVYGTIRQNGGSIQVESTPGEGSRFDIYLPHCEAESRREETAPTEAEAEAEAEAAQENPSRGEKILLVEDNEEIRDLLSRVLLAQGYSVYQATEGNLALEIFQEQSEEIQLVISDIVMPRMDGLSLSASLREMKPHVKILLISGHTDRIASLRELQNRNVNLLCKPFHPQRLLREVRRVLDGVEALPG